MFFGYPIEATEENWLHDCLCAMVHRVHDNLDEGKDIPDWPDIIPPNFRDRLKNRKGLKDRLEKYSRVVSTYKTQRIRKRALRCLDEQNKIDLLVSCGSECESIGDLPKRFREPVSELFGFSFHLLTELGVRDRQYDKIYRAMTYHVCPFCGCEYFDAPAGPREDLDHYLPLSLYPFAATNLRNLVPMGMKCNERYKKAQDILRDAAGTRRRSFFPYAEQKIDILVDDSIPFGGEDGQSPSWKVEFEPTLAECKTWNDVFEVRERIERDVLSPSYRRWLNDFAKWFVIRIGVEALDDEKIKEGLKTYSDDMACIGFPARDFLRAPVFRMLYEHCSQDNARLLVFMRGIVTESVPQETAPYS